MAIIPEKIYQETKRKSANNNSPSPSGSKSSIAEQRQSTSRSSVCRARSTHPLRHSIRSAVPDTSVLTMAKRPDRGGAGKSCNILALERKKSYTFNIAGQKLQLYTNHFKCNIPRQLNCHQYDIELEVSNRDGTWRPAKKDDRFFVLKQIIDRENFPFVWYDEGKSLYSTELLVDFKNQYEITIKDKKSDREQKYRLLLINLVKSYSIQVEF